MGLLCIRDTQLESADTCALNGVEAGVVAGGNSCAGGGEGGSAPGAGEAGGAATATRRGTLDESLSGGARKADGQDGGSVAGASPVKREAEVPRKATVLERRALVQLQRVLQAAVDSVPYGGVTFSLEAALHALPAAVAAAAHVPILCELGIVELLVAVVKQCSTATVLGGGVSDGVAAVSGGEGGGRGGGGDSSSSMGHGDTESSDRSVRVVALAVRVMRRMCSPKLDAGTQSLCVQRLSIVGAVGVLTTLVQQLKQLEAQEARVPAPSSAALTASTAAAGVSPGTGAGSCSSPSNSPDTQAMLPAIVARSSVLDDASAVLGALSTAAPLASP